MKTREFREFELEAKGLGYRYAGLTSRGHWKWRHPNGALVITISKMDQWRDRKNSIRNLRHGARRRLTRRHHHQQEARP